MLLMWHLNVRVGSIMMPTLHTEGETRTSRPLMKLGRILDQSASLCSNGAALVAINQFKGANSSVPCAVSGAPLSSSLANKHGGAGRVHCGPSVRLQATPGCL